MARPWQRLFLALSALSFGAAPALANPVDKGIGLQDPATEIMRRIEGFHNGILLWTCILIVAFVLVLLLWIMIRYNARANPTPATFTHSTLLEIVWTAVPVLILVAIAFQSFPLLAYEERIPENVDLTVKATGSQWYWDYEYPDNGGFSFTSKMLEKDKAQAAGAPWLLATNEPIYLPVGKTIKVIITAADVIHSWTVPAFGVKKDAVPGRLNAVWFKPEKEGVFYGQCSELCGAKHAFMPIEVHVVSEAAFNSWVEGMKQKFGALDQSRATDVADAR
ncbi:MAG: cytochrome c oxidase subunit II [Alphaproteobacteria bacterium]